MKRLDDLAQEIQVAKDLLEAAVLEEIDKAARHANLDKIIFGLTTSCYRRGKEVDCQEVRTIEHYYLDHVNSGGFHALWSRSKGWH